MSTQPTELPETTATVIANPKIHDSNITSTGRSASTPALENHELRGPRVCATRFSSASLLDEPWKIRILPDEPEVQTVAPTQVNIGPNGELLQWLPAPDPHAVKSQPWRRGDVTRLQDDSPKGMMDYIATHTKGWWQELAERALRDNEKAERLVREAGWQPGQCWALEVDAEAKQKLLQAEEAKRQREEAERAREAAEKETFMQRQMELLKKAGKAPRCEYLYTDGRGCRAPQVKGERWCHGHAKAMSYRPEKLEMELMEDEQAVMVNLYRVTKSLLAGRISEKTAGLMLWSVAIGMPGAKKSPRSRVIARNRRDRKGKTKTLPLMNADPTDQEETVMNRRHAGVTTRKSFKSGVRQGSTPVIAAIARDRKGKGLPLMNADKRGSENGQQSGARCQKQRLHPSASPRLRGETSGSIRVHPRQSAVSSGSSSVSPRLGGEIQETQGETGL